MSVENGRRRPSPFVIHQDWLIYLDSWVGDCYFSPFSEVPFYERGWSELDDLTLEELPDRLDDEGRAFFEKSTLSERRDLLAFIMALDQEACRTAGRLKLQAGALPAKNAWWLTAFSAVDSLTHLTLHDADQVETLREAAMRSKSLEGVGLNWSALAHAPLLATLFEHRTIKDIKFYPYFRTSVVPLESDSYFEDFCRYFEENPTVRGPSFLGIAKNGESGTAALRGPFQIEFTPVFRMLEANTTAFATHLKVLDLEDAQVKHVKTASDNLAAALSAGCPNLQTLILFPGHYTDTLAHACAQASQKSLREVSFACDRYDHIATAFTGNRFLVTMNLQRCTSPDLWQLYDVLPKLWVSTLVLPVHFSYLQAVPLAKAVGQSRTLRRVLFCQEQLLTFQYLKGVSLAPYLVENPVLDQFPVVGWNNQSRDSDFEKCNLSYLIRWVPFEAPFRSFVVQYKDREVDFHVYSCRSLAYLLSQVARRFKVTTFGLSLHDKHNTVVHGDLADTTTISEYFGEGEDVVRLELRRDGFLARFDQLTGKCAEAPAHKKSRSETSTLPLDFSSLTADQVNALRPLVEDFIAPV